MKKYPSIALLELSSIAVGIFTADIMVKRSPITVLKSGTVHNGKFLILIGGSVASVEESFYTGIDSSSEKIIDQVQLPDVHQKVHDAILGYRQKCLSEAIGIIETSTVAAIIKSADAAVKGASIEILEIRIADDLGGKAFAIYNGEIEDVQSAIEISKENVTKKEFWIRDKIIPRISPEMAEQLDQTTVFKNVNLNFLPESEI
ncbi:MAG: BMC domain-containing protein [Calditrichia bacterium]|nr:BMC domain-containing protein [Calditrichia bacterium]